MATANSTSTDAVLDIEAGMSLLATLACLLEDATADDMTGSQIVAASALCQKAGALLESGLQGAKVIDAPGVIGLPENWIRLGLQRDEEVVEGCVA
jgi:hypothetical protein